MITEQQKRKLFQIYCRESNDNIPFDSMNNNNNRFNELLSMYEDFNNPELTYEQIEEALTTIWKDDARRKIEYERIKDGMYSYGSTHNRSLINKKYLIFASIFLVLYYIYEYVTK